MRGNIINSVARSVFHGLDISSNIPRKEWMKVSSASLPLQICLYFHAIYTPFWVMARIFALHMKFPKLSSLSQAFLVSTFSTATCVQIVRLYLGYSGNILEKVPRLVAFWLTSTFLQVPLLIVLAFGQPQSLPLEKSADLLTCAFLCAEIVSCLCALRAIAVLQREHKTFLGST